MAVGIITGSGTNSLTRLAVAEMLALETPFGPAECSTGRLAEVDAVHLSRHGPHHARLSNQGTHQANIWALNQVEVTGVIGCTACGAVDPTLALGSLVVENSLSKIGWPDAVDGGRQRIWRLIKPLAGSRLAISQYIERAGRRLSLGVARYDATWPDRPAVAASLASAYSGNSSSSPQCMQTASWSLSTRPQDGHCRRSSSRSQR